VQAAEARPGNRALVHHIIAFVRPPDPVVKEAQPASRSCQEPGIEKDKSKKEESKKEEDDSIADGPELLIGFAPGLVPMICLPDRPSW